MIYTPLTMKAMQIAYKAHHGQKDQSGMPYIFHPYHLAEQMKDEITTCVALLHDTIEDTEVTFEELEREFPKEVMDALKLLTHEDGADYFSYVEAIKTNPIARVVKLADLEHNTDKTRLIGCMDNIPPEKLAWWDEKYAKAKAILEEK